MNFRVIWRRLLGDRIAAAFAEAWEEGRDAEAITRAIAEIDRRLSRDPANEGESRADYERILVVAPVSVVFEVHEDERVVLVLRFRYVRPR